MSDLFSIEAPSVARPASRERAIRETNDGSFSRRLQMILDLVTLEGVHGLTWKEAAGLTGLHHGQVSAALSTLHDNGMVVSRRMKRERCHPYIARRFVTDLEPESFFDSPVKTRARHDRETLEKIKTIIATEPSNLEIIRKIVLLLDQ